MPDDHSKLAPPLPIPNRTVKRLRADDSADSRVKVGHRQALTTANTPRAILAGGLCLWRSGCLRGMHMASVQIQTSPHTSTQGHGACLRLHVPAWLRDGGNPGFTLM